jgi:hypothetical protein
MSVVSIDRVLSDERLLGGELGGPTWATWRVVLRAAFGLSLDDDGLATFRVVAGNRAPPGKRVRELWVCAGRRSGKSRVAAALALFFALFVKHRLAAGESPMVLLLAATVEQARVCFNYTLAFLRCSDLLCGEVAETTRSEIRLKNGVTIAIHANSFRSARGRTACAIIFDEVGYWFSEATARPDTEAYTSLLPSLLTTNGMLVGISTPYRKNGLLHGKYERYFGVDSDDMLVVQGPSMVFNATLDDKAIAAQMEADPVAAQSEWNAVFRDDLESFVQRQVLESCVPGYVVLPPDAGTSYFAFADPAGGTKHGDSFAAAIAHRQGSDRVVVDALFERAPPFNPAAVIDSELVPWLKSYGISRITGDKWGGGFPPEAFARQGIRYEQSEQAKSELYRSALPLLTSGRASLPRNERLIGQFAALERRVGRSGADSIDHPRGQHDDVCNAVAGVLALCAAAKGPMRISERAMQRAAERPPRNVMARRPAPRGGRVPWFF